MILKLEDLIYTKKCYAHRKEINGKPVIEFLENHLDLTKDFFHKLNKDKIIKRGIKLLSNKNIQLTNKEQDFIYDMIYYSIYFHDIGKINPYFQYKKMKNKQFKKNYNLKSNHSMLSAFILYQIFKEELENMKFEHEKFIKFVMIRILFLVSRHHGDLKNFDENNFIEKLKEIQKEKDYFINYKRKPNQDIDKKINISIFYNTIISEENKDIAVSVFILMKLVYSLILTCDRYATDYFMEDCFDNDLDYVIQNRENVEDFCNNFQNSTILKNIRNYQKTGESFSNPINNYRSNMFIEAEEKLLENIDKNIFYLEMPVGAGKTNTSLGLATQLLKNDKSIRNIFYVLPFNSIATQTYDYLMNFGNDFYIHMFNSVTPIAIEDENCILNEKNKNKYYHDSFQNYQFMHYQINVISHIKLFSTLFSCNLQNSMILQKYADSIIILDEIQCYKNSIWRQIITMLESYAKIFNMKIIIMSATLPKLSKLISYENDNYVSLIENPMKYYSNNLFKSRVICNYDLLNKNWEDVENFILEIYEKNKNKKIVIEFIKKKSAYKFYEKFKDKIDNCHLLTGDNNLISKRKIISKIKNDESIFIITTQVLEAGVDVSFNIGFKDSSILDNEEQFLGRINRNNEEQGFAYFFNKDDCNTIYKNDVRTLYSILDTKIQKFLNDKNFEEYYEEIIFPEIKKKTSKCNENNIDCLYSKCVNLSFLEINNLFKLIENDETISIIIDDECFDEQTNKTYNSEKLIEEYKELEKNKKKYSYSEYMIKKSKINSELLLFERNLYKYELQNEYLEDGYEIDENLSFGGFIYLKKIDIFI